MPILYTDPDDDVPPRVDFLNADEVRAWVAACELDKPWRRPMRARFAELITTLPPHARVLELGCGPGLLAECILDRCSNVGSYTLLDFSEHMLTLGRARLERFDVALFVNADFAAPDWTNAVSPPYSAVIAMQAVHEIRHKRHVPRLYQQVRPLLAPGGMMAVCDGTPGDSPELWRRSLCLTVEEQREAFVTSGFGDVVLDTAIGSMILMTGRVSPSNSTV